VVPAPVAEHVRDDVARVALGLDHGRVVAEPNATVGSHRVIERARRIDREAAHPSPKRAVICCLHDEVDMIVLQRKVDDAKRATVPPIIAIAFEHVGDQGIDLVATEIVDVRPATHRDVDRHRVIERLP